MNRNIRILISEKNERIIESLTDFFSKKAVDIIFCEKNGQVLLDKIKKYKPDVVLCDVFMRNFDAIAVKERACMRCETPPVFIIISSYDNEDLLKRVMQAGFNYYFIKPFEPEVLYDRMMVNFNNYSADNTDSTIDTYISSILRKLEMPSHLKGYAYIHQAVKFIATQPEYINNITTKLYPDIAELHDTTASRVERSIRTAVEISWERAPERTKEHYFPYYCCNYIRPSNKQFIAVIADVIKSSFTYEKMS